ncbi:MAG: four helix bundle protein [Acidobacteriota bacterium]|nr:four helix bundle protein [Acidobacteriota bacterium]
MNESGNLDLKIRTKKFALRIIRLYKALPNSVEEQIIGKQILRSGTSVGAQYREGTRARSTAEFISKIESASQELEETMYWFELLIESEVFKPEKLQDLHNEADELMAIFVSSVKKAKERK